MSQAIAAGGATNATVGQQQEVKRRSAREREQKGQWWRFLLITVVILYVLGGEGIHGFAFCMVVGSIVGTYSTVYIASPLVLIFMKHAALRGGSGGGGRRPLTGPSATPAPAVR